MQGFDFFCKSDVTEKYGQVERDRISQELKREESVFFSSLRKSLIQSAVGLDMLLERHLNCDMAFITAFLTATNEEPGDRSPGWGKKYFREGEVDTLGNSHIEGDEVDFEENQCRNESLAVLLTGIGYNFVRVLGHYDDEEHSYCVLNYVEDTHRFIDDMMGAATLWNQDSVLIIPRRGYGKKDMRGRPFMYYPKSNLKRNGLGDTPQKVIGEYYTIIGKDHFEYPFDFKSELVPVDSEVNFSNGLYPVRRGRPGAWVASNRRKLRESWGKSGTFEKLRREGMIGMQRKWSCIHAVDDDGIFPYAVKSFLYSAKGADIGDVDSLMKQTQGFDVGFISAFNGDLVNLSKEDYKVSKEDKERQTIAWQEATDRLWELINEKNVKVITVQGLYKVREKALEGQELNEPSYVSEEKTFMIINELSGLSSEAFTAWIDKLGKLFKQRSVLVKPARQVEFSGKVLDAEVGYEITAKGGVNRKGVLRKGIVENWATDQFDASQETVGGSRFFGTGEEFTFSRYTIFGLDFSGVYDTPCPNEMKHHRTMAIISNYLWHKEGRVLVGEEFNAYLKAHSPWEIVNGYFTPGREKSQVSSEKILNRRESIKSSYLTNKIDGLDAFENLRNAGLAYGDATELLDHWAESRQEVMSSTGPHTLAEWKLYEKAKKMCDGGFSYKDALGILSRDSGIPYGKVRDIVGTAEEWSLGYFDFGLEPLIHVET